MPEPGTERPKLPDANGAMTRRDFLRLSGGLVILFSLGAHVAPAASPATAPADLEASLRIDPDGGVTIFVDAVEVGQGILTSLAQIAADELTVPLGSVRVIAGDTGRVRPRQGPPGPAIPTIGLQVRAAAAEAREAVAALAADTWGVPRESVAVRGGKVTGPAGQEQPLGDVVRGKRLVRRLSRAPASAGARQVVGKPIPRVDGPALVTGTTKFVADMRLPQMAYGAVFRPPCLGARLVQADVQAAARQPGVISVVREGDFIGIVAARPEAAEKALRLITATWDEPAHPSMAALWDDLRRHASLQEVVRELGDVDAALASARRGYSATYATAFVAHAPIEPHAALAAPEGGGLIVYASTQRPFAHRDAVAAALGLPPAQVRVIAVPPGGAFGGKDGPEVSVQAARLSRAAGRPVLLAQTRREEMTWNYFRPAALIEVRCGVDGAGRIVAWDCSAYNCGERGLSPPYRFPNQRLRTFACRAPLPQGPWRGLGGPANVFARESHLDHIAAQLHLDPVELRLRHLDPDSRLSAVVRAAAQRYGWGERRPPTGLGVGFACAVDDDSCVAQIADVEVDRASGAVRVRRVIVAQDSGLIINPEGVRSQIEGAVVMALGFSLKEAVRYEQGRILTDRFASYPVPTMRDLPAIDTVLLGADVEPPQGAAIAPILPLAAAIANAVFDATGRRLRELPMTPARVLAALRA